jgi:hypothetical protein
MIHLNSGFFYTIAMWKRNPINSVKEGFAGRYPGVRIPASSTILILVKKVRPTGSFLDKKYTRQNAVLTEETLDKIGASMNIRLANPWHE